VPEKAISLGYGAGTAQSTFPMERLPQAAPQLTPRNSRRKLTPMKAVALLALLASLAAAPLAPASVKPVPVAECAAKCCQAEPDCCSTACPCPPLSCHVPAAPSVMIPAGQPLAIFAPGSSPRAQLTDDTCSVRTSRPPVPPPRA
jgi:hypothetical protein